MLANPSLPGFFGAPFWDIWRIVGLIIGFKFKIDADADAGYNSIEFITLSKELANYKYE